MGNDTRQPKLSVIIPVYNAEDTFRDTLDSLFASKFKDFEVVLVDDASTDSSMEIARDYDCRVLTMEKNSGPSAARNRGASQARADILFFTDSDVIIQPVTIEKIMKVFEDNPDSSALIGCYTIDTPCSDFFSTFKNLVHHYTHKHSLDVAITFWAGCGAIRKEAFQSVNGFNEEYKTACIEDIELGYRLTAAGHKILLVKNINVTHNKKYDFIGMVKSDVFNRAVPWTALMLREGTMRSDLNTTRSNAVGLLSAYMILLCFILSPLYPPLLWLCLISIAALLVSNKHFYAYAYKFKGAGFMLKAIAMNFIVYLYSGVGLALGVAAYLRGK
jgi:glycosyltransferase involved in cell wall biosynthesis